MGYALAAYLSWGLLPLYWALLREVGALEVLAHRVVWSLPFALLLVRLSRRWGLVVELLRQPGQLALLTGSALLIGLNWGLYIWAVLNGRVVEASLGYYLMPLVTALLGVIAFGERPWPLQWLALALAAASVGVMLVGEGRMPWVSLTLASSVAFYSALRKHSRADAAVGLLIETVLLVPLCLGWLIWLLASGSAAFTQLGLDTDLLLLASGMATVLPMLWYVAGARRMPLATLGILFYLNPTLQFLLGVLVFDEAMPPLRLAAFCLIWISIALYVGEELRRRR